MLLKKDLLLLLVFLVAFLKAILNGSLCISGEEEVFFEKVGQFNDGGMAVNVLVKGNVAYVCEFDNGLEILDISNPAHIVKLGQVENTEQSRGIEVLGHIAYVSCNTNGLKLFDISDHSRPVYVGEYGDRDGDPHQLLAEGEIGYLTEWHGGFDIIDLSDPIKPFRLNQYKDDMLAFSVNVSDSYAYVTGYRDGLKILDVSESQSPILVGEFNNGGETNAIQVLGDKAYVCDKQQGLEIMDITYPDTPRLMGTYHEGGSTVGVCLAGSVAFTINWELGLEAVDISHPERPVKIGSFFDGGRPNGIQVIDDLIYVADGTDGLEILRFRKKACPAMVKESKDFPILTGPYVGQTLPGMTPKIFAPGIVSLEVFHDFKGAFSPDGQEYYFCRHALPEIQPTLYLTKVVNDVWTEPAKLDIAEGPRTFHPCVTHDNRWLLFYWQFEQGQSRESGYYASARTDTGWSAPAYAGQGMCVTADDSGFLYATEIEPGNPQGFYMNKITFRNGLFTHHERLYIDSHFGKQTHPCIAPDGSFIIFDIQDESSKLFVCFKNKNGDWGNAIDLTEYGLQLGARNASISPDGKCLFYGYEGDIWWVDAKIIEELKPE